MPYTTLFVDVLLPLPVPGLFTYRVPQDMNDLVEPWKRVVVQFGKKKVYTGIVVEVHEKAPQQYSVKYILSVIDQQPVMNSIQYKFWKWIAGYYMSELGEVMNVGLPSALKLASESKVSLNPDFDGNYDILPEKEYLVAEALSIQKQLTLSEIENIVGLKNVIPLIKSMMEKGVIIQEEELRERYKPAFETYIRLAPDFCTDQGLKALFDELEKRAFRQVEVLMGYINLTEFDPSKKPEKVVKSKLLGKVKNGASALGSLIKKGVFENIKEEISRLEDHVADATPGDIELTPDQLKAFHEIKEGFKNTGTVLFHGVTSSGKTEIYIKLIEETLKEGKQVLYLLPEIALTTQIINRLRKYFGDTVGVYHSKYNENERVEIWNNVLNHNGESGKFRIVLGPRSAMFLPFAHLGLVIIDEEHDYSYKQFDPAPRYNARDAGVYLALLHGAKTVLGSATPSIESYFNAKTGKYGLVELFKRYGDIQMPEILVANVKKETREKTMKSHFSGFLMQHIQEALQNHEQVILFQNRRGYSLRIECNTCGWLPECKNCDVTLTYHKHNNQLRCHYCGYTRRVPERCDACGSTQLLMKGFGTEKLEDELAIYYPDATIKRMDLDSTRSKYAYQSIINDFENRRIDILVGTQMVTKGLDFDHVSMVGIMNADNMISFPDFRSYERSFQQMAQVSGRAGRKNKRGKVIIQTFNPFFSVISDVINNDYASMYRSQILERRNFKYPPFYRLIHINMKHKDSRHLNEGARNMAQLLRDELGNRILGPEYPLVSRIKNLYIKRILVKLERDENLPERKKLINELLDKFRSESMYKNILMQIDVDPV